MEKVTDKGNVVCQVCGQEFPIITPSHLKRKHEMSLAMYREKFPDAFITSVEYKAKQRYLKGNLFTKGENPVVEEVDLSKLNLVDVDVTDLNVEKVTKEKEDDKEEEKNDIIFETKFDKSKSIKTGPDNPYILPAKSRILEFLKTVFPANSVINNYMIEKLSLTGFLEYRIITDIAIPLKKIDLEFPKVFWHNHQMPNVYRNLRLERDGWTVIEINEASVDSVRTYLEHRKLI